MPSTAPETSASTAVIQNGISTQIGQDAGERADGVAGDALAQGGVGAREQQAVTSPG
jgi:hypothetical protein